MIAVLSLLYVIPALLSIIPSSATLIPDVEVPSPLEIRLASIAANRGHVLQPPAPSGTKAILASRQYNPRKRPIKRRFRGRALPSTEPVPNTVNASGIDFDKFYEGSGFTESDDNPTAAGRPISQTTYPSTVTRRQAIQSCAEYTVDLGNNLAFQLYFLGSQDIWVCRGYWNEGNLSDDSYFNVANDDVLVAYGYQFTY